MIEIKVGSFVVYENNYKLGSVRKHIYEVIAIEDGRATLESLSSGKTFTTDIKNCVSVDTPGLLSTYMDTFEEDSVYNYLQLIKEEAKIVKTDKLVNSNVNAAKVAAKISAGKTLNKVFREKVTPALPLMVRGYADTVVGEVVIANVVSFMVDNFLPKNEKARLAADAMLLAAMNEFVDSFNIDEIVAEALSNVDISLIAD